MGTFKLHISCTQAMCSLQYRPHIIAPHKDKSKIQRHALVITKLGVLELAYVGFSWSIGVSNAHSWFSNFR